ncbi:uncharacterized protein LOC135388755 [Ornithodoros turicata]|uniref:uncharacterized protein LOC135388755 n=1 Tax=Ornithodoros turicata TaxID=34597 RepID=UPI00313A2163
MYCLTAFFLAATVTLSLAATTRDSNQYIDTVLQHNLPGLVRGTGKLYPVATIPDFKIKVESTSVTNRDLKADLEHGAVHGLDTRVRRAGDCNPPVLIAGNVTISCILDFSGINATFAAEVKGDSLLARKKVVPVNVTVTDTTGRLEATALPGAPATIRTFYLESIKLRTKYGKDLSLNDERKREFKSKVEEKVNAHLYSLLYNDYQAVLNRAIQATPFPRV